MKQHAILDFLRSHPLINIQKLEKQAKIPLTALHRAVKGTRGLPESFVAKLEPILKDYGYVVIVVPRAGLEPARFLGSSS